MMSLITTFVSSGNFVMATVLGGSMQLLYGLVRSMQLIITLSLKKVPLPAHTRVFFQGAILFANMDLLSGEDFYENNFQFRETQPLNDRFDDFGIGDMNLVMNSGSFFIM